MSAAAETTGYLIHFLLFFIQHKIHLGHSRALFWAGRVGVLELELYQSLSLQHAAHLLTEHSSGRETILLSFFSGRERARGTENMSNNESKDRLFHLFLLLLLHLVHLHHLVSA